MKKTDTYSAVLTEIARLKERADELRRAELPGVIERIRGAITAYGLTAADLGFGGAAPKAAAAPAPRGRKAAAKKTSIQTGVPKYRDPKTGKTWTGRGKPPLWIVGVKDRTPFLIDGATAPAEAAPAKAPKAAKPAGKRGGRRAAAPGRKRAGRKTASSPAETKAEGGDNAQA